MHQNRFLHLVRPLSVALVVALSGCAGGARGGKFGAGYEKVPVTAEIQVLEHQMAKRLNRDRAAVGLAPLTYDDELADVARAHSHDMHTNRFFAHESPSTGGLDDRLARAGYLAIEARENLAEAPDVDTGQDVLLASPGHHANIMAQSVTNVGIGIVKGGVEDPRNLVFTQVFAKPGQIQSPAEARRSIIHTLETERRAAGLAPLRSNRRLDELAESHIGELPMEPSPRSLQAVGEAVANELSRKPIDGVAGVSVGGQLLWDTGQFVLPAAARQARAGSFGLAVRRVSGPDGRPQLKILLLLGL